MQRFDAISTVLLGVILGLTGGFQISAANENNSKSITPETEEAVPGPLDGLTFRGALGPDGKPKDIADVFVFENGTFVSKECELQCKYPARPYFVRINGSKTEFISETQCPYKDAKIVWRGIVEGDRINHLFGDVPVRVFVKAQCEPVRCQLNVVISDHGEKIA